MPKSRVDPPPWTAAADAYPASGLRITSDPTVYKHVATPPRHPARRPPGSGTTASQWSLREIASHDDRHWPPSGGLDTEIPIQREQALSGCGVTLRLLWEEWRPGGRSWGARSVVTDARRGCAGCGRGLARCHAQRQWRLGERLSGCGRGAPVRASSSTAWFQPARYRGSRRGSVSPVHAGLAGDRFADLAAERAHLLADLADTARSPSRSNESCTSVADWRGHALDSRCCSRRTGCWLGWPT